MRKPQRLSHLPPKRRSEGMAARMPTRPKLATASDCHSRSESVSVAGKMALRIAGVKMDVP